MPHDTHGACYGRLFPPTLDASSEEASCGKVFGFELLKAGGMWRNGRRITRDLAAWDECLKCPEFDGCYRLSLITLMFESAISDK